MLPFPPAFFRFFLLIGLLVFVATAKAQDQQVPGSPTTLQNAPERDTSDKTNDDSWHDAQAIIFYKKLEGVRSYKPDTSLHFLHRRPFSQLWLRNLGNEGTPVYNMMFTPESRTGPTLGYHAFDPYLFVADSLLFYNTTNPYSRFGYGLGSKAEQVASLLHTQNITPRWNTAFQYRKINSPGFYKIQRTNHDAVSLSTNYQGARQHYQLQAGIVYNKMQQDENGGLVADSFLQIETYNDRKTIPVAFQNDAYSIARSAVTNTFRDIEMVLHHSYTLGKTDTVYNEDSTQYAFKLVPRFRVGHHLKIGAEKYQFKDLRPDSLRYADLFQQMFGGGDSVFMSQERLYVDNLFLLEGLVGKQEKQSLLNVGYGVRTDHFTTNFSTGETNNTILSNYLSGTLKKEALAEKEWAYEAQTQFFITGAAAGNLLLKAHAGKELSKKLGTLSAGFKQTINNAPYNFTRYQNQFYSRSQTFNKETVTQIFGSISNEQLHLRLSLRNQLLTNYFYLDRQQNFSQFSSAFSITQVEIKKLFYFEKFVLDNDIVYQQKTNDAPVNVPAFMGRHQLSLERYLFGNALKIATGIDVRWHSPYAPAGYAPFFNRFFYQTAQTVTNAPEAALFFSFKIKNFRAYFMGDQLQQFIFRNNINFPGYPAQEAMFRFGFSWVMIN